MKNPVIHDVGGAARIEPNAEVVAWLEQAIQLGDAKVAPNKSIIIRASAWNSGGLVPAQSNSAPKNTIVFDGVNWALEFSGKTVEDSDRVGWRYISRLVRNPYAEIHSTDLVIGQTGQSPDAVRIEDLCEEDVAFEFTCDDEGNEYGHPVTAEFFDEILPDNARNRIEDWLGKAQEQLKSLQSKGKVIDSALRKEDIRLTKAFLKKNRFKGKNVYFSRRAEVDRKSVAKAIKEAIKKIAGKHPLLSKHLSLSVKTGEFCSYRPKGIFLESSEWSPKVATN